MSPKLPSGLGRSWLVSLFAAGCAACASAPPPPPAQPSMSPADEQLAIEAAKQHPIAQPRERPLYPDKAPPPLPERGPPTEAPPPLNPDDGYGADVQSQPPSAPPPYASNGDQYGAPSEAQPTIAPSPPPPDNDDAPESAPPGPDYIWAPGYWSWAGTQYVWAPGDWIERRPGYSYVRPRWVHTGYGWQFTVGGWGPAGGTTVVYPVYGRSYYGPRYNERDRGRPPVYEYRGAPRERERVYVAPRATEAPPARRESYVAPRAEPPPRTQEAPAARRESYSAPRPENMPREAPQRSESQPTRAQMPAGMPAGGERTRHEASQPNPTASPAHSAPVRATRVREPSRPVEHRETVRP